MNHLRTLVIGSLLIAVFLPIVWSGRAVGAPASEQHLGASAGEKLHFQLHWLGMVAGEATLQMDGGNRGTYALQLTLTSSGAARVVRAIDDQFTTGGERRGNWFIPQRYIKEQRRNEQTKWITYPFDREMRQVPRTLRVQGEEQNEKTVVIPIGSDRVLDPLSTLYTLRAWPELRPDRALHWQVTEGEKVYCLTIQAGERQQLQTELGDFSVVALRIAVDNSESFRQRGPILFWVTDDARRLPIQIEAQLSFGAAVATLVAWEDGRGGQKRLPER
ncbi:MAG: DUF3108 domain-containing protein [Magnetococcales bacterium]|nr:DUF3108 domain-containing protein [Magnetococcales bacterium]